MKNWFLYLSLSSVLFSFISSLRAFRLGMPKPFRYFSFFLLFVLLSEIFGVAWSKKLYQYTSFSRSNQWFYNIFHFLSYLFLLYFFSTILNRVVIRKMLRILVATYVVFALGNLIWGQGWIRLNTYTELLAGLIMVFLSISYYYQLLYAEEIISLQKEPAFWICTGILIYHLGTTMGLFIINVMNVIAIERARSILFIIQASAILMYINFSIAFLCRKKI